MASTGKRKTTMAKLARESKLRERRVEKKARKDARRQAAGDERAAAIDGLSGLGATDADPAASDAPAPEPGLAGE